MKEKGAPKGNRTTNESRTPEKKEAARMPLLYRCLFLIILVFSLIFFATKLVEYNRLLDETEKIEEEIGEHEQNAAELRYLIDSPVDDAYIIRMAREKLGLVFPDEEVFYNNLPPED